MQIIFIKSKLFALGNIQNCLFMKKSCKIYQYLYIVNANKVTRAKFLQKQKINKWINFYSYLK